MNLIDIPRVESWLAQFEIPDRYVAEYMLRRLRYVSFLELESWLQDSVDRLLAEIFKEDGRVAVAVFPVAKPFVHEFNKDKEQKPINDSAGRIAHSLKNIERDLPGYVELSPRLDSMRQRKVRHIIFVDDFIGTGERFLNYWREMVSPSIKSWCSLGWCKLWLITFAAHKRGISRLVRNVWALDINHVRAGLVIQKSFLLECESTQTVLRKYSDWVSDPMGYGGLASPVIFQYGCPNNAPQIFWHRPSRRSHVSWQPLFPNRSVTKDLYPLFCGDFSREALPEELWMAGHYHLALNALERISRYSETHRLMLVLGLLAKGYNVAKIKNIMVLGYAEFDVLLGQLKSGGLIDINYGVTRFGWDVLSRAGKTCKIHPAVKVDKYFFPSSFLGFQRET